MQVHELLEVEAEEEDRKYPSMGKWAGHVQSLHAAVMSTNRG